MKTGNQNDLVSLQSIEDAIWKTLQQGSSNVAVNNRKPFRILRYRSCQVVDGLQEFFAKP